MLTFPDEWRFGTPGGAPEGVKPLLSKLISVIAATNQRETYETFKSNFAAALGEASSRSSSTSWAETDMIEYFERSSAANEALFIQAFYDSCEQLRAAGVPVPGVTHLNRLLADGESRYHLDPPRLTRADEPVEASSVHANGAGRDVHANGAERDHLHADCPVLGGTALQQTDLLRYPAVRQRPVRQAIRRSVEACYQEGRAQALQSR